MKKITQFSVNNPVTVSMIVIAIILLGYISFGKLSVDLFPDMNAPRIFVEIKAGERPPEEIEKQYIEDIEAQAIRQKGVSQVSSICMVGSARVTIEYTWGRDMDEAFLDLQKALTTYSQNANFDEFTITQHDPNASPVMIIGMFHPEITDMDELRKVGENYIRNELIRLEGIADVTLTGTEEKEILIETEQYKMDAYGLTTSQIVQEIQNMNRNVSGGTIVEMGKKYIIKGSGLVKDVRDIENIVLSYKQVVSSQTSGSSNQKAPIFLKDVAKVSYVNKDPQNIVRINGKRCVGLSVYKETGSNTVKAVEDLTKSLESIKKALPGYEFIVVQNQGKFIQSAIDEVQDSALIGAFFAVFVLFIFLRRIKVTAIISLAIPISVIATFNLMYFNGLTLNVMTLGGLALGAGMLVDNAIVVMENIFRNMEQGMSVRDAAIQGTAEVGGAITASTLTTIVVFLPIVYLQGASGALFKDQAWTVAFSLLASLFVAILVIPMLFNYAYKNDKKIKSVKSVKIAWYGKFLSTILDNKGIVLGSTILLLAITVYIFPKVGSEYLPKSGAGEFSIEIKLSEGTQLERTSGTVKNIESMLADLLGEKVDIIYSQIGPAGSSTNEKSVFQNENTATLKIRLNKEYIGQSESIISTVEELIGAIPDAEVSIIRDETALQSTLGTDEAPMVVEVKGKDLVILDQLTSDIKTKLQDIPELLNIKTNIEEGAPEIDVVIDRYKAGIYNMSVDNIISQLKDLLMGKDAGKYEKDGEMNDITVKLPNMSLSEFNSITLKNGSNNVPLYEVARIEKSVSPKQLFRRNQNRIGKVMADVDRSLAFDKVIEKVREKISTIDIPQEYQVEIVGEEQKRQEAMSGLSFALILSIILVYMVMASQFESLIHPFTILLTIPLAGVGAIWGFFIIGKSLSIMAYIGMIMLAGIAVNDSIILVDAINQFKAQGLSLRDSIISAGENRIRPIIMTSLTTILALLPLTFGMGESAALRSPMAIAVIGGLITSTILTLIVIPCVYYVFEIAKEKIVGIKKIETNS
ncbi:MAG: acriflavine resistance protein B [Bacteroidetes bacterium GWF2_33_16]|nr:MAG: acriflavine resistance protein B [Bacteroidetes bacterium GWE2_32_14]OFY05558.1 MAG: acriflavine resistance protein B [Bacteroidetes bacterium GWF2_33_16]